MKACLHTHTHKHRYCHSDPVQTHYQSIRYIRTVSTSGWDSMQFTPETRVHLKYILWPLTVWSDHTSLLTFLFCLRGEKLYTSWNYSSKTLKNQKKKLQTKVHCFKSEWQREKQNGNLPPVHSFAFVFGSFVLPYKYSKDEAMWSHAFPTTSKWGLSDLNVLSTFWVNSYLYYTWCIVFQYTMWPVWCDSNTFTHKDM